MLRAVLVTFVDLFVTAFNFLLLIRIIMSWIYRDPGANRASGLIFNVTEPVLAPVRRVVPAMGMLDLSPLVTFFLLQFLQILVHRLLAGPL